MSKNFLFGYGSLINSESRKRTGQSGIAVPVRVKGIQRQWNLVVPSAALTGVGAIAKEGSCCNGVIAPVSESELPKFDERELPHGYTRVLIKSEDIKGLSRDQVPDGLIWTYLAQKPGAPSDANPITQSYIDVIISGCLDFNEKFAREFIESTSGWGSPWVNDRSDPRYIRAMPQVLFANKIDSLLQEVVPDAFGKRISSF